MATRVEDRRFAAGPTPTGDASASREMGSLRPRAVVVGAAGVVALCILVPYGELVAANIQIGVLQLSAASIGVLFALVSINYFLPQALARWRLTTTEVAAAFVMMMPAPLISARGLMERWLPLLVGVKYYGPANGYDRLYYSHIPRMLVPWDPAAPGPSNVVKWFYEGLPAGAALPWRAWVVPLAIWSIQIAAVYTAFFCMTVILRKHWVDNEKLTFPLAQLPLEMIREPASFLGSRAMWAGFTLASAIFLINGLHQSFPALPEIPLEFPSVVYLTTPPWSKLSWTIVMISPAVIGLSFLLPVDLLFSFWFFFLLGKAQELYYIQTNTNVPFEHAAAEGHVAFQAIGAFVAMAGITLYAARQHLRHVRDRALRRTRPRPAESMEMLSYPVAVWGLVASLLVMVCWAVVFGMSWYMAALEFGVYLFVSVIVIGRCTAEAGLIVTESCFTPTDLVLLGQRQLLGPQQLTMLSFYDGLYTRDLRGVLFTGLMDAQKIGGETRVWGGRMRRLLVVGVVMAVICAAVVQLWLPYRHGALNLYTYTYTWAARQFFQENAPIMGGAAPRAVLSYAPQSVVAGFLVCLGVSWLRWNVPGLPLHPLGYTVSTCWAVVTLWASIFLAWLAKSLVLRYGGMRGFLAARPFFLGLIFGEFLSACLWTLARLLWGIPTPKFPWP